MNIPYGASIITKVRVPESVMSDGACTECTCKRVVLAFRSPVLSFSPVEDVVPISYRPEWLQMTTTNGEHCTG